MPRPLSQSPLKTPRIAPPVVVTRLELVRALAAGRARCEPRVTLVPVGGPAGPPPKSGGSKREPCRAELAVATAAAFVLSVPVTAPLRSWAPSGSALLPSLAVASAVAVASVRAGPPPSGGGGAGLWITPARISIGAASVCRD